jgi:superfamily I DNA/RNA helicase
MNELNGAGIPPTDIIIFGKRRLENWPAAKQKNLLWSICEAVNSNRLSVAYSTIHAFKGLEAPVVIMVHVDSLDEQEESLLYVGMSRARARLYILIDEECRKAHTDKVSIGMAKALKE